MAAARKLDGKAVADQILDEVEAKAARLRARLGRPPGLGVLLVGDDPASAVYVRMKERRCRERGLASLSERLPASASTRDVVAAVKAFNDRDEVDGILVQLPLPRQVDQRAVIEAVHPAKDVDGFHPLNVGRLVAKDPRALVPCTPLGVMELLRREGIEIEGRRAVILGRSDIVGKPMALLLMHAHATVTICHSRTADVPAIARQADILVAALGRPWMVNADYVKEGAVVIDVGINRVDGSTFDVDRLPPDSVWSRRLAKKGHALLGDVDAPSVRQRAGALTPVPGSVGPLTIAMLLHNTCRAAARRAGSEEVSGEAAG